MYRLLVLVFCFVIAVHCSEDCDGDLSCAESRIKSFVDQIDKDGSMSLLGNYIVIEKTNDDVSSRSSASLEENIVTFFTNHALRIRLPTDEDSVIKAFTEARSSKLKKIILPLILFLKLKAAIIIPAVLSAVALVAFKGLGAALVALSLSGATAFKSLLESHASPKLTYEVVPQISSHWSRSGMDGIETYPIPGYHTLQ